MLIWSWSTWPDPVVDFGREEYVPWRITQGDVLYRDIISCFNGPLTPYVHALLFKVFGTSLRALVLFNLLILLALVVMLHRLITEALGRLAATTSCIAFLIMFAFGQYLTVGNYNYVCPYSYELPHGITLTVAAIVCLNRWNQTDKRIWLIVSGILLGLIFLTKAEIFAAAVAGLGAGLAAIMWVKRFRLSRALKEIAICAGCAIVPVIAAMLLLMTRLSAGEALYGMAGAWKWMNDQELLALPYFSNLTGTADLGESFGTIFTWAGAYCLIFGGPAIIALLIRGRKRIGRPIAIILFIAVLALGYWRWAEVNWRNAITPIQLFIFIATTITGLALLKRRSQYVLLFTLLVWSLAMLIKIRFAVHVFHYGFALAMPATLMMVALLVGWLPKAVDRAGGSGIIVYGAVFSILLVVFSAHALWGRSARIQKVYTVGEKGDAFLADRRGQIVNEAIAELNRISAPDSTLAVLPEGLTINYLARRVNPTGHGNFTPPALLMYGEESILGQFQLHPPDFVMIDSVVTPEYGVQFFGVDYAQGLSRWIQQNYAEVSVFGPRRLREPGDFGIVLMKKRA